MTTTATIRVRAPAASPLEAKIVSSDVNSLHLEDDDGNPFQLGRDQVFDVDHPGNVLAWLSVPNLWLGTAMLADYYTTDATDAAVQGRDGFTGLVKVFGWTSLALGTALAVTGTWSWARSKRAARAFESER